MSKVFGTNGALLGWRRTADAEAAYPIPSGATVIEFDEATNPEIVVELLARWDAHEIKDGTLQRDGAPVQIHADSAAETERKAAETDRAAVTSAQIATLLQRISARQAQIDQRRTALAADFALLPTATAAQQRQIIGRLLNSEDDTLAAEKQELTALDRLIRAMRRLV